LGAFFARERHAHADHDRAVKLFLEARELVRAERCVDAIPKLEASLREEATVGAWLNLGTCKQAARAFASAQRAYAAAAVLATQTRDTERLTLARSLESEVAPLVTLLVLEPSETPDDLQLLVDNLDVPRTPAGYRIALDPGAHVVVARSAAHETTRQSAFVPDSPGVLRLPIQLEPLRERRRDIADPSNGAVAGASVAPASRPRPALGNVGIGLMAGGAIALGVGSALGVIASGQSKDLRALCPAYPRCAEEQRVAALDKDDALRNNATGATVSFVAGAVMLVGGVTLFLLVPRGNTVQVSADSLRVTF